MDIRQKLKKMANDIVEDHIESNEKLTPLAIKTANENKLPEKIARHLAAEVNKTMVLKTGSQEFEQCNPDELVGSLEKFQQTVLKKTASYNFNEYNTNVFSSSKIISSFKTKKASENKIIVNDVLKEENKAFLYKEKTASALNKRIAENKLNEIDTLVDKVKRYGYSFDDLISKEASLDEDCIRYGFQNNLSPIPKLNKNLFEKEINTNIDLLKKTANEFKSALQNHIEANNKIDKLTNILNGIDVEGDITLNV